MKSMYSQALPESILMITPFYKAHRGNSRTVARLAWGMREKGIKVQIFSLETANWPEQLRNILRQQDFSLVHGFHGRYLGEVLAAVPELSSLPLVLTATGTDLNQDLGRQDLNHRSLPPGQGLHRPAAETVLRALQAVRRIVVFHPDFHQELQAAYPQWSHKIAVIPQGVYLPPGEPCSREQWGLQPDDFVFLLPSGFRPIKDIGFAIQGLTPLAQNFPQVRLVLVGEILEPEYAGQIQKEMQDQPWIRYLGSFPHPAMSGILSLGNVVLNTSKSEGQPQGALEAMSLGIPCLLRSVPGNRGLITAGNEGFYVASPEELSFYGARFISQPGSAEQMGQRAQKLVQEQYTFTRERAAYLSLYQELLFSAGAASTVGP